MNQNPENSRPGLRASDAEREQVAAQLQTGFSEGRLTYDELQQRVEQAYAARTRSDLDQLLHDLPPGPITRPDTPPFGATPLQGSPPSPGSDGARPYTSRHEMRQQRRSMRDRRRDEFMARPISEIASTFALLSLILIAVWFFTGVHGGFWPEWPILIMAAILVLRVIRSVSSR